MNFPKEIRCRDSQNQTRVQSSDRGHSSDCVRAIPCLHKALGAQFTLTIRRWTATLSGHPFRYSQTLNCPPANQPIVLPGLPAVITLSVCSLPQQDDNRLINVRRFGGTDFRMFDRRAVTASENLNAACIEQRGREQKFRQICPDLKGEVRSVKSGVGSVESGVMSQECGAGKAQSPSLRSPDSRLPTPDSSSGLAFL